MLKQASLDTASSACVAVKGRRAVGDVEVKEREWAKVASLRGQYWLYVVYDCGATHPRLLSVRVLIAKLLVHAKGGVEVVDMSVFEAAKRQPIA